MGFFYRTIRMLEHGIKPLYVFDGVAPDQKADELRKRSERRSEAAQDAAEAAETGTKQDVERFARRLVRPTRQQAEECRRLLRLMGVPYVDAPGEAEAQCSALAHAGSVYATASEDMDSMAFGTPLLLRHMTFSEAKKMPIMQISLHAALDLLSLRHEQFVDLCILLGCDYCSTIRGIGPKKALALIKEHGSIEGILRSLDSDRRYQVPSDWAYAEARRLFANPLITDPGEIELHWTAPDEEGLLQFLVKEKNFSEDRVKSNAKKLKDFRARGTQGRLDGFIRMPQPAASEKAPPAKDAKKKKVKR